MSVRVVVYERTDPTLEFWLKRKLPGGGGTEPLVLTGATEIELLVKNSPDDADGAAIITRTLTGGHITIEDDGSGPSDKYSIIKITLTSANLTTPGTFYYHIAVTKGGGREVVAEGFFEIKNI